MPEPLPVTALEWTCDLSGVSFATTDELAPTDDVVGQPRALEALEFGLEMPGAGYNLFVLGREGSGRHHALRRYLTRESQKKERPPDWCYLSNFEQERAPRALKLPRGVGRRFRDRMASFVGDLKDALRAAFQGEEFHTQQQVIEEEFKERQESAIEEVRASAKANNLALMRTPVGFTFAPLYGGKVIAPDVFEALPQVEQDAIGQKIKEHESRLQQALRQLPNWAQAARDKMRELNKRTAAYAIDYLLDAVRREFEAHAEIHRHLEGLHDDVLNHLDIIIAAPDMPVAKDELIDAHPVFRRYLVNLLVDNGDCDCAPVVFEDEPSFDRLLGLIEQRAEMGALFTDFHLVRPGALHRANGGFLVIDARKILMLPMAWEALKRALSAGEIRIESLAKSMGFLTTMTLEPSPIPLNVKVVLVGDRLIYHMLDELDPEFRRLFKVAVDFDDVMKVEPSGVEAYLRLIVSLIRQDRLAPFERPAVERVLQHASRLADDRHRFTTQIEEIADLLRGAAFEARKRDAPTVGRTDVVAALEARRRRIGRIPDRLLEAIEEGTIAIDTAGRTPGQINALSVSSLGTLSFGRPTRVTARVSLGKGDVVDIEREVKLGGPLHSKGILILANLIRSTFGRDRPLSLHASLVFEQSYGGVDGDSASLAEACALVSAIAGVPIAQRFAITGSINQLGHAQAIGGVNDKIEGFFDICVLRGLSGDQGVIIPASNVRHLVLAERVVDAVREGRFVIVPVATWEEAIHVLTEKEAGTRGKDGLYPRGTVFAEVDAALTLFDERRKAALAKNEGETG